MAQEAQAGAPVDAVGQGRPFCPLKNLGNTCYINANIQALVGVPAIKQALITADSTASTASQISLRLRELVISMSSGDGCTAVSLPALVDSLFAPDSKWVTTHTAEKGEQQCADDFLQCLLEQVPKLEGCVAFEMLGVNHQSERGTMLRVGLVQRAGEVPLSALIHAQYNGKLINFSSELIVVTKRWSNNGPNISLDSTEFLFDDPLKLYDASEKNIAHFSLSGFVEHRGRSFKSGHYTAVSRRTINDQDKWLYFNDDAEPEECTEEQMKTQVILWNALTLHHCTGFRIKVYGLGLR